MSKMLKITILLSCLYANIHCMEKGSKQEGKGDDSKISQSKTDDFSPAVNAYLKNYLKDANTEPAAVLKLTMLQTFISFLANEEGKTPMLVLEELAKKDRERE